MDDEKASLIIQDLLNLYSIKEVMERHNVSKTLVERIRQKQRYKHLIKNVQFPTTSIHRNRTEMLTIIFYTLKYLSINSVRLSKLLKEHLNIKCSVNMILNIRNNSTCKEYIKFVKSNNWKPSETIEMDKLVTE